VLRAAERAKQQPVAHRSVGDDAEAVVADAVAGEGFAVA
jgi:hypothetical protein